MGLVQGSGLGPTLYIVMESDLKTISKINVLFKYANDNNLLVPEKSDTDICVEFANIVQGAADSVMIVNVDKTKEIVFHRPSARSSLPNAITGIEQVVSVKLPFLIPSDLMNMSGIS